MTHSPSPLWKKTTAIGIGWTLLTIAAARTPFGYELLSQLEARINFHVRDRLGHSPTLDPRIKIYSFDDRALSFLGSTDLSLDDWGTLLESIDRENPRAIFIDKYFGLLDPSQDAARFRQRLRNLKIPVVVGSFVSSGEIPFREPLSLTDRRQHPGWEWDGESFPTGTPERTGQPYGPVKEIVDGFRHLGHIMYAGEGRVHPLIKLGAGGALPHFSLFAADRVEVDDQQLRVNGIRVPQDEHGRVTINLSHGDTYFDQSYSMLPALIRARRNKPHKSINPGDFVVLLPAMYTGNNDFAETPLGPMEGGYLLVAMINSVLSGRWVTTWPIENLAIALMGILGTFAGVRWASSWFIMLVLLGLPLIAAAGMVVFAYQDQVVPWLFPCLALGGSSLLVFLEKSRHLQKASEAIRRALTGVISDQQLAEISKDPNRLDLAPKERVVTVAFIDIVGFSLVSERHAPDQTFHHLRALIREISDTVHRYGGIVDNVLGDGILCFFGHSYDGRISSADHATQAVQCAMEIQQQSLKRIMEEEDADLINPLRIGINSANVIIGDLGGERQLRPTIIGDGVNFAKRLESSCDSFRIMIGPATKDALKDPDQFPMERRPIKIKHHAETFEAYEIDPFAGSSKETDEALNRYRQTLSLDRREVHFPVPTERPVHLQTNYGEGRLINFSESGLGIFLHQYVGKGVSLKMSFVDRPPVDLTPGLRLHSLDALDGEIRWGRPFQDGYFHGLKLIDINEERKRLLVQILRDHLSAGPRPQDSRDLESAS